MVGFFVHLQLDRYNLCCQSWVLIQCIPVWDRKPALNFSGMKEWSEVLDAVNVNEPASVFVIFGTKLFKSNNKEWSVQSLNVGNTSKWESPLDVSVCMCVCKPVNEKCLPRIIDPVCSAKCLSAGCCFQPPTAGYRGKIEYHCSREVKEKYLEAVWTQLKILDRKAKQKLEKRKNWTQTKTASRMY